MALVKLEIPPGVFRNGTEYQVSGRWYDSNLVRWIDGLMMPVGGWERLTPAVFMPCDFPVEIQRLHAIHGLWHVVEVVYLE